MEKEKEKRIFEMRDRLSLQIHLLSQKCVKLLKGELNYLSETKKLYEEIISSIKEHEKLYLNGNNLMIVQDCIRYAKRVIDNCERKIEKA